MNIFRHNRTPVREKHAIIDIYMINSLIISFYGMRIELNSWDRP